MNQYYCYYFYLLVGESKTRVPPSEKLKENVIDNSFEMSHSPYTSMQTKVYPPKSSVHISSMSSFGNNDKLAVNSMLLCGIFSTTPVDILCSLIGKN